MRFFLDNNLSHRLIAPIAALLPGHTCCSARDEGLTAVDDIPLFAELKSRDFDAIITRDRSQLSNIDERQALVDSGLHWLGTKDTKVGGLKGVSLDCASITVGLAIVLPDLLSGHQHAFTFYALPHQREQRVKPLPLAR
jgi:PIN domain-containing protein